MLSNQMWRAARLVSHTGIRAFGWTLEPAPGHLGEHTALPEPEAVTEIDRYISWPGQTLSYYLGKLTIARAQEKAELALGASFGLRPSTKSCSRRAPPHCHCSRLARGREVRHQPGEPGQSR